MDATKLRAWWWHKQGLSGVQKTPEAVLEQSGWARSVGGVNPYLSLFARSGCRRADAHQAGADLSIANLPAARGCTYVVPQSEFALALKLAQPGAEVPIKQGMKYLGVTDAELEALCQAICDVTNDQPQDPKQIKDRIGDASRSLGEEGKKRGQTTTLPLGLGRLQAQGLIRKVPLNGRFDTERFGYVRWDNGPDVTSLSDEEAHRQLAQSYFRWIGPATFKNFQWFSGLGVAAAKAAASLVDLVPVADSDYLILKDELDAFHSFSPQKEPSIRLVSALDAILLLRRSLDEHLDPSDQSRQMASEKGRATIGGLQDLANNAIMDRGRIIGLWEYDPEAQEIAHSLFVQPSEVIAQEIERTQIFIREELGDARSFSLDSPESRKPRIELLRQLAQE